MIGGDIANSFLTQPSRSVPRPGKSSFDKNHGFTPAKEDDEGILEQLKQAIKDYKDENLTGLTDEERKKIDEEVKAYMDELRKERPSGVLNDEDVASVRKLLHSLLKKYGAKAEGEEMIMAAYLGRNKNALEYKFNRPRREMQNG
jgi:hypothetical protein